MHGNVQLRSLAAGYMRRERVDHTLRPTALVNEAYLRLLTNDPTRVALPIRLRTRDEEELKGCSRNSLKWKIEKGTAGLAAAPRV